jgi:hypothetical protein
LYALSVVSTTIQDLCGPEELLPQHKPRQLVGKSHRAERQSDVRRPSKPGIQTEIASEDERESGDAGILQIAEHPRKPLAVHRVTTFIERHHAPPVREPALHHGCLGSQYFRRITVSAGGNRPQREIDSRPSSIHLAAVAFDLILVWACRRTPEPQNLELQASP